ncbi:diaminobutyrate--2-oxoglutarate transaminase [Nocardia terpenica]|uniref:Diaminobutyrate--2-oxoglutarate transaminase n=1 Tax=Nocardia terpenica TaxID=455432 RepID=A0A164JB35_9NOCA|nr:diaminobutyrate--2-oxoglutarate transaminase [Nocardia terpenica]KZM70225.1 diaminobutyrate--2-oxoglutarate transaminase [Nocardia terpenica]MBF6066305.1 diaminobutyrate--2-oxoglutarate transaminase [Nocardia terpenica]MBF6108565.1 diaminobutyrate--2-oxoglutarate transaminase [Nocardia terpenica]MBF6116111.1 diaminobutyrate--2-oxoglutarate transaminase [Nocardia terpenica]MBF6123768.1 diaminobutyrate--2-oxoglutarate transaminase [Nocardia terpenica]
MTTAEMTVFESLESDVRGYCRSWPTVFDTARGSWITDAGGREYLDFFAGAGALNYGHNNPVLKTALLDYIGRDGITHGLDMATVAKRELLETIEQVLLDPRGLDYKVQFPGPTGANAVEAALKLARKVTGRTTILNFTNAFHGMTLGALSVTGNAAKRAGAGVPLVHVNPMPYDGYLDGDEGLQWMARALDDHSSGVDKPAAVIVETVQGEGGVNVARPEWLRQLSELCSARGILLIVDDVQMGCGRTGPFFSFEIAGITPDIVTLSKSIGGYGMPLALVLMRRELDQWAPGEHNGTFRGNNPAFVTATVALDHYWRDDRLTLSTMAKGERIHAAFASLADTYEGVSTRGRGLVHGLVFEDASQAGKVSRIAFEQGLLVETSGAEDQVVKLLPPLTITDDELDHGLSILGRAVETARGGN